MASEEATEIPRATYEQLALMEQDFEEIENEMLAKQFLMTKPLIARRAQIISTIPNYWALVFEQAPPEVDGFIQPSDSEVFAAALKNLSINRPEIPSNADIHATGSSNFGEPRSVTFRFEFEENKWFEDKVVEKTFWWRHTKDGSASLVSDPVRIHWKAGQDLTEGLTDAVFALWEAQKKAGQLEGIYAGDAAKKRAEAASALPEFAKLREHVEQAFDGAGSFFNFFLYRGRWTSAAENKESIKDIAEKRKNGKPAIDFSVDGDEDEDEEELSGEDSDLVAQGEVEVFPNGHDVAIALAEDLFPGANQYFLTAQEGDDEDLMSEDFEDIDEDDDDDMEIEDEDGNEMSLEEVKKLVARSKKGGRK